MEFNAQKFLDAQKLDYDRALSEIKRGRKITHWIWYIFPQLAGLGSSLFADYYGINGIDEARAYMQNETLSQRLIEITTALLSLDKDIEDIMGGYTDMIKLRSSMTLFREAAPDIAVFQQVLDKFYGGEEDSKTMGILYGSNSSQPLPGGKPSRGRLIDVFNDTMNFIGENDRLSYSVTKSIENSRFYSADTLPEIPEKGQKKGEVTLTRSRTFEAAVRLSGELPGRRICVLNFASATNPGGGVKNGSRAQEECLCRCSTLYPTLDRQEMWDCYYSVNRQLRDPLHTDACIYSPDIIICKSDIVYPERLPEEEWVTVDVITCAAPNLRSEIIVSDDELKRLHISRAEHIMRSAIDNGADVLVLGAFGCGAFMNDPYIVASAYRDAVDRYDTYFERIEFAIFCADYESENYRAFAEKLM